MTSILNLTRKLLASLAIDLFLIRPQHPLRALSLTPISLEEILSDEEQKYVKKEKLKHRIIPPGQIPKGMIYKSKVHYVSTKSRNVRDLDQRKIRRKFKNC